MAIDFARGYVFTLAVITLYSTLKFSYSSSYLCSSFDLCTCIYQGETCTESHFSTSFHFREREREREINCLTPFWLIWFVVREALLVVILCFSSASVSFSLHHFSFSVLSLLFFTIPTLTYLPTTIFSLTTFSFQPQMKVAFILLSSFPFSFYFIFLDLQPL